MSIWIWAGIRKKVELTSAPPKFHANGAWLRFQNQTCFVFQPRVYVKSRSTEWSNSILTSHTLHKSAETLSPTSALSHFSTRLYKGGCGIFPGWPLPWDSGFSPRWLKGGKEARDKTKPRAIDPAIRTMLTSFVWVGLRIVEGKTQLFSPRNSNGHIIIQFVMILSVCNKWNTCNVNLILNAWTVQNRRSRVTLTNHNGACTYDVCTLRGERGTTKADV